jgi:protein gp37
MIENDLPFKPSTAQRLMKIAADERLSNAAHGQFLPPSWRTLYELTKLPDDVFEAKLKSGEIHPEMQRKDAVSENRRIAQARAENRITLYTNKGEPVPYRRPDRPVFNWTPGEGISWANWSWNPVTGCLHDCHYCYARDIATSPGMEGIYPVGFTPLFHPDRLACPANTKVPEGDDPALRRVFVVSMGDLYGKWVPEDWIKQVHQACVDNPQWEYLMLTKFPRRYVGMTLPPTAWLGTSVDEQKRVRLAEEAFREIKGVRVKWLSLEPLLAPLKFSDLSMFDWVVIGAQTETYQPDGKGGRAPYPAFAPPFEWVARIVAQAREAGCLIHMKPNLLGAVGPKSPGMALIDEYPPVASARPAP